MPRRRTPVHHQPVYVSPEEERRIRNNYVWLTVQRAMVICFDNGFYIDSDKLPDGLLPGFIEQRIAERRWRVEPEGEADHIQRYRFYRTDEAIPPTDNEVFGAYLSGPHSA